VLMRSSPARAGRSTRSEVNTYSQGIVRTECVDFMKNGSVRDKG
jgi:hypothetical protein